MKKLFSTVLTGVLIVLLLQSCSKESETFTGAAISDYYPLQTGRAFIYRMDSTIPAPFGTSLIVHSYQAKDSIEATFTDNQGRLSYRIFRFVRDTAGTQAWRFAATYVATPTASNIEYVDNNMRFIKLATPLRDGFTFKAHTYIDTKSLSSVVPYLDEWDYTYESVGQPLTIGNKQYAETVTVAQHDETTPPGPFNPSLQIQIRTFGVEVYAKGVGLVYKEFMYWNWQQNPPPANFDDASYGVKLTLLEHY